MPAVKFELSNFVFTEDRNKRMGRVSIALEKGCIKTFESASQPRGSPQNNALNRSPLEINGSIHNHNETRSRGAFKEGHGAFGESSFVGDRRTGTTAGGINGNSHPYSRKENHPSPVKRNARNGGWLSNLLGLGGA